jgi:ABC-type multidrug transport system permease subunit
MDFQSHGFWLSLGIGLVCLAVFIFWLWKGGRKSK